jgi:tricorn protease
VFSYQGDLWTAPSDGSQAARRLTVHPAYDGSAMFSPDGKSIAFNSGRYGRTEVFVMPSGGGSARRLTNYSGGSSLQGWANGGDRVLLASIRELQRRGPAFYTVGTGQEPGRPRPLLSLSDMLTGQLSPDGKRLVFARGSGDWPRRGYRGAANADIWVYTLATRQFRRLTDFDGQDLWPRWLPDSETVVYVSERDGTYNLYRQRIDAGSGQANQITRYKGDGVRLPSVSGNGTRVAFEIGDRIATVALDSPNAAPHAVPIAVAADDKINPTDVQTLTDGASEIAAAPDGEQIAFAARGDLFVIDKAGGRATRLTDVPERDDDVIWAPDGKTLVYVSNRHGHPELYAVSSTDAEEPRLSRSLKRATKRLTNAPGQKRSPQFSPDGTRMAYIRDRAKIMIVPAASATAAKAPTPAAASSAAPTTIATGAVSVSSFSWSPDGRWLVFAGNDEEFNSDIYIVPADNSKPPVNISRHPQNDFSPAWSPDGNKIFWTSERMDRQYDLYYTYLRKEDDERTSEEWARLREKKYGPRASGGAAPGGASTDPARTRRAAAPDDDEQQADPPAPATPPPAPGTPPAAGSAADKPSMPPRSPGVSATPITIDFDGIDERVRRLTSSLGDEGDPSPAPGPDGHILIAFRSSGTGLPELSLIDFTDGGPTTPRRLAVGSPSSLQWTRDGRTLLYRSTGGAIASLAVAGGGEPRPIPFRARYTYDRRALQLATFDEAWQTLNEQYYDPGFHGADWAALRGKYRPLAAAASDPADFYDVIRLMMGHLNSSHIGVTGATTSFETTSVPTGALGVVWDESYTGPGLKIARVIKDSPADRTATKLRAGEIITAINGQTIEATTNPDELLADTVDERTPLQVTGTDGKSREVILLPTTYARIRDLLYDEWVEQRKEMAHRLSGGKIAYLHIRGMDKGSQDRFEQGLYAEAHGRNALLIDVRDNGGGSTADYLLTMLTIPRHAYTIPRDGAPGYPQDRLPLYPWQKPAALLINQNSYSNAEIFAHAFKTIGRGPVLGRPTFGAVISTGARPLLDGSSIRTPNRGWYNVKTGVNQEHTGARPDQLVEFSPADELSGRDPQLEAAVKTLLARAAEPSKLPAPKRPE